MTHLNKDKTLFMITQETLMNKILPIIKINGVFYKKFKQVHARPAIAGEVIVSRPSGREETTNTAEADDIIVRNLTEAKECYILKKNKFEERYTYVEEVDKTWRLFNPVGEAFAIKITDDILKLLGIEEEEFKIIAPWGSEELVLKNDMFVSPPSFDEVYRIAYKEFFETYK